MKKVPFLQATQKVCKQCGKPLQARQLSCGLCGGKGTAGWFAWKRPCEACDATGKSKKLSYRCPQHPLTWDRPRRVVPPYKGIGTSGQPTFPAQCSACHGSGMGKQWGLNVPCALCRPGEHDAAIKNIPPPGYFTPPPYDPFG